MIKNFILAVLMGPIFGNAQNRSVAFEQKLTWPEILKKAKAENKYVFVDCYASWCTPCIWMDVNVYSKDTVADIINNAFVAVKIQMDSTRHDAEEVRQRYAIAHMLGEEYRIRAYPMFLFFSPDGRAVHADLGSRGVTKFLGMAKEAMDPHGQYYSLISAYKKGAKIYDLMPRLSQTAKKLGDDSLSTTIAKNYLFNYLIKLSTGDIWTKGNLAFINSHSNLVHNDDPLYQRYWSDRHYVDSILGGPGMADILINNIVYDDEIKPALMLAIKNNATPNWRRIGKKITRNYGFHYMYKNLLQGKVNYYRAKKNWANYTKYFVQQIESTNVASWPVEPSSSIALNNYAFEVFNYSNDKKELGKALAWINHALEMDAGMEAQELDTKANLLYKLDRKDEGMALEERSHGLAPKNRDIQDNYNKMKNGLPTWEN